MTINRFFIDSSFEDSRAMGMDITGSRSMGSRAVGIDITGSPGFTLLELVLAIAISGLLITAVSSLLLVQIMHWQRLAAEMEARAGLERSMAMILRDVRDGASLVQPSGANRVAPWLEIRLPISSLGGTTVVRYEYDSADQEIQRNGQPLAGRISGLAFDYENYPPLVHVQISGYGFREVVHVVQGTAALRSQIR